MKTLLTFSAVLLTSSVAYGADLQVANVVADRTTAPAGEQIAVDCDVVNAGVDAAAASRLKYYFSTDATLDAGDKYLNYDNVAALAAGTLGSESANLRIPAGTVDGNYHLLFVADFDDVVAEQDEDNNVFALPITVGTVVLETGPDLTVHNASAALDRVYAGEVVAVDAEVANIGSAAAAASQLKYYLSLDPFVGPDDKYLNYDAVAALDEGALGFETANVRVPAGTSDGLYYVLFVADSKDALIELDESNNVVAVPLIVGDYQPLPNLQLNSYTVDGVSVRAGETIPVSAVVQNAGDADAAASKLKYFLSSDTAWDEYDKQLSYDSVDALVVDGQNEESANVRIKASTNAGSWYILFVVDAEGTVVENDESDNIAAVPVQVVLDQPGAQLADLTLSGAALSANEVAAGDAVNVSVLVSNAGAVDAVDSRLKYFLSTDALYDGADDYLNYDNVGVLAPGASVAEEAALSIPAGLADGNYYVLLVADHTKEVEEQYESNNVVALPLTIGATEVEVEPDPAGDGPDLMVVDAAVTSTMINAGERAALQLSVENVGNETAAAGKVKYYLSRDTTYAPGDKYLGYDNVPELAPGEASAEDVTPMIAADTDWGSWYLLMVADATDVVAESFESNNVTALAIEVVVDDPTADAADLVLHDAAANKSEVGAGLKVAVDVTVANDGTQPAGSSRLKLYLSNDAMFGPSDVYLDYRRVDALAVAEESESNFSVRIPAETANGDYQLLLVADANGEVAERYESDNVVALPITVGNDTPGMFPYACPDSVWTDSELLDYGSVATLNALHLGWDNGKDLTAMACVVAHFDVVGLVEIFSAQGLIDLEAALENVTGEDWGTHLSETAVGNENGVEFYGYAWRAAGAEMTGTLGFWDDPNDTVKRDPYGANFRIGNFDFSLVVFHLQYGQVLATRRAEAAQLVNIYDYFQALNGTEDDVLIGGDFNLPGNDSSFSIVGHDAVDYITDPEQKTSIGADGLVSSFDNIFFSTNNTTELIVSGAHDFTNANHGAVRETVGDHIPVWMAFDTSVDDD